MAEKTILGRIIQKHDIEANWNLATDFIPKQGEIIVYDIDENYTYERFKIGDGVTNVNDLPFASVTPDWSVNDPNAAGYIENRTHWVDTVEAPLTFDGDTTGREVLEADAGEYFVKMSDVPKTAEELIGSTLIIKQSPEDFNDYSGPILELVIDETNISKDYESDIGSIISVAIVYDSGKESAYVFLVQGDISETGLPLSEGVYFVYGRIGDTYAYAYSLSCLTGPQEVVHKLDKKYLPNLVSTVNGQTPDTNGNVDVTVPTKTSELTNDSGFITASDIPDADVPTKISELENDAGYLNATTGTDGNPELRLPEMTTIASSMFLGLHGDGVSITDNGNTSSIVLDGMGGAQLNGDFHVQTPTANESIANKKYVDDAIADTTITSIGDGSATVSAQMDEVAIKAMGVSARGDIVTVGSYGNFITMTHGEEEGFVVTGNMTVQTPTQDNSVANKKYVDDSVAGLVDSAPATLNTLKELSAALGNDENFATTVATQIGNLETEIESVENRLPTAISSLRNDSGYITIDDVANEVYVGDGDMPEDAKVQFIMDDSDEEALLKNELIEYIDQNMPVEGDIIQSIMEQLQGLPVFGVVDENNNITITNQLSDGVYTLKYENTDGTVADIVTFTIGNGDSGTVEPEPDEPTIINWISESINADDTQYVGANGEDGYNVGHRINSSGVEVEQEGMCCTGYIPYNDQIIRLADVTVEGTKTAYLVWYYPDKSYQQVTAITDTLQDDGNGVLTGSIVHAGYIRITCGVIDDTSILTLDQEIV